MRPQKPRPRETTGLTRYTCRFLPAQGTLLTRKGPNFAAPLPVMVTCPYMNDVFLGGTYYSTCIRTYKQYIQTTNCSLLKMFTCIYTFSNG